MGFDLIAQLILQIGLPATTYLFKQWSGGKPATEADFTQLNALASQTAQDRMKAQLAAAGIPLTDPHAVALMALVS